MLSGKGDDCEIASRQKLKLQQNGETKAHTAQRIYVALLAEAIHLFNVSCILLSSEAEQNLRQWQHQRQTTTTGAGKKARKCLVCIFRGQTPPVFYRKEAFIKGATSKQINHRGTKKKEISKQAASLCQA